MAYPGLAWFLGVLTEGFFANSAELEPQMRSPWKETVRHKGGFYKHLMKQLMRHTE